MLWLPLRGGSVPSLRDATDFKWVIYHVTSKYSYYFNNQQGINIECRIPSPFLALWQSPTGAPAENAWEKTYQVCSAN